MAQPYSTILTIDFETRYSTRATDWYPDGAFGFGSMTTEEYIRHPLFKAFGACIHEVGSDRRTQWYSHEELPNILATYNWDKTAVLAHNAMFDVGILSFVYDIKPCFIFDSLSMARALRGVEVGNSLAKLAAAYELPDKGQALASTNGLFEITPEIEKELAAYCAHDVYLCEQIFSKLVLGVTPEGEVGRPYPKSELRLISMTLKMFTEPELILDVPMLEKAKLEDAEKLEAALVKAGVAESDLASNEKFAELLEQLGVPRPMKTSKTTGKPALALAKTDALFQAMLNGDNEDVALLCEARLKVKSTGERTRAQRFLGIASRGPLPVPLNYYGAGTGRYAATGKINLQNLKRGSFLRNSIMAPVGFEIIAGDLSQIEPRVLAWLADYDDLLDIFRAGGDPYATFGAQMFGIPGLSKESHPLLRQSAKSGMLGCFGATTLVLTQRGWVPIVDVRLTDTTWDGIEWTKHNGVVAQGEKEVLSAHGIQATSDHEILTGHGWQAWSAVLHDPSLFQSALSLANSPVSDGCVQKTNAVTGATTPVCAVAAAGRGSCTDPTSSTVAVPVAEHAQNEKQLKPVGRTKGTTQFAQTVHTVTGSWIASARSLFAVQIQRVRSTLTTAGAALASTLRGSRIAYSSWHTLSPLMGGTIPSYNSIGKTTNEVTSQATYALSHVASTWPTNAAPQHEKSLSCANASLPSKQRMPTYDIALAGPRNRYTILTDAGPIIVHNCGYQLGWSSFAGQLLVGFLGAPPQRYTMVDAKMLGVTKSDVQDFLDYEDNVKRMEEIPHTCTEQELLIHCLAAKAIIDKYRTAAAPIVQFWNLLGHLIAHSLVAGNVYEHKCLTFKKGEIVLANGMSLLYPDIQIEQTKKGPQFHYAAGSKRVKLYAGKVCNNCIAEGTRVLTSRGWVAIESVRIGDRVHDGTNFVVHKGLVAQGVQTCVTVDGVYMTPDHEVLTNAGWLAASQCPEPYRPALRNVGGARNVTQSAGSALALSLRLWSNVYEVWFGRSKRSKARGHAELRLSDTAAASPCQPAARAHRHDAVGSLDQHAREVQQPQRASVQKLRRAWHHCVQALGQIREFCCGYGTYASTGIGSGAQRQQQRVYPREHCLGYAPREQYEQTHNTSRGGRARVERGDGNRTYNDIQPHTRGMAYGAARDTAVISKQVFDIVDCGSQQRFVVMGSMGPFIVHNCVQGTARIVMTDAMLRVDKRFPVKGTVHDELLALAWVRDVAEGKVWVKEQMIQTPKWMPGIPLNADVGAHVRYGLAKK